MIGCSTPREVFKWSKGERDYTMARELIALAKEQPAFREVTPRALQSGEIRVRSRFAAAKHGTEMALYKGYADPRGRYDADYQLFRTGQPGVRYPVSLGNMAVGDVIEVGPDVTDFA